MRAVISVIGKDAVGIISEISQVLRQHAVNIVDISQSVLSDMFVMVMLTDISSCDVAFPVLCKELVAAGETLHLDVHVMHEDIFNAMHRI